MSSRITPMSSRHTTPASDDTAVLTPSRKVQALLAQFSDSDSDSGFAVKPIHLPRTRRSHTPVNALGTSDNAEEDDDEVIPKGRLAARLLGARTGKQHNEKLTHNAKHDDLQTAAVLPKSADVAAGNKLGSASSSEDELLGSATHRTRQSTQGGSTTSEQIESPNRVSRSESPLFFPSPNGLRVAPSPRISLRRSKSPNPPLRAKNAGRSKLSALVDKHRRERIAREAAEVAKRAAGIRDPTENTARRARGSSPADSSSEGSDTGDDAAAEKIQKQARPTRKAGKKALEEMHRETQRMSRNMQLAHQATTKKKITKESLLEKFNFPIGVNTKGYQYPAAKTSTASSSTAVSDAESTVVHEDTPPTSPLQEDKGEEHVRKEPGVKNITHLPATGQVTTEMHGAVASGDDIPSIEGHTSTSASNAGMLKLIHFINTDTTVQLRAIPDKAPIDVQSTSVTDATPGSHQQKPVRVGLARTVVRQGQYSDSDDEIEIIRGRGQKRKYAAFESLPRGKAKEMPSHLALRTLAHLAGNNDKQRSLNAAELEATLRRKARVQALEERRQRIEELKAKGIVIQTADERERDQQEVEDLVERARQEAAEIQKREKELAKKDGTYIKDNLDDDDDSEDEDFEEEQEDSQHSGSEEDGEMNEAEKEQVDQCGLFENEAEEAQSDEESDVIEEVEGDVVSEPEAEAIAQASTFSRRTRRTHVLSDDEDEETTYNGNNGTPRLPRCTKMPQSVLRSNRKTIPGLQMSDDLPMGLSQAFAATMAESQPQNFSGTQDQESLDLTAGLPSPRFASVPNLRPLDSVDIISDSQPSASQTQPLNVNLVLQSQVIPESPRGLGIQANHFTPSQRNLPFELTQDNGYIISPFKGNRFSETPNLDAPDSTAETVLLPAGDEDSPVVQRRGRLQRGRIESGEESGSELSRSVTAFQIMKQAAKTKAIEDSFDKKKSNARNIVDDAAEESEDEYAGLGGASDDSGDDEENEDDRRMIDEDTQVGKDDEAKLAGLFADRERERDEKEVSKLLKDITTGALRRKRGVGDDLDLSDEEDAATRRREAKRREFARMRRELLKDEAVGKIAEDKKKEAFLRSIEDHEGGEDEDDVEEGDQPQSAESQSQSQSQTLGLVDDNHAETQSKENDDRVLATASESKVNRLPLNARRTNPTVNRKPTNLAEIRESVSFLIEEPDSQAAMVDLGLSDSEDDAEAYVDLDRHFKEAEADENELDEDAGDLGDFIIDDELPSKSTLEENVFKKPELPRQERAPFNERRTKHNEVVDRLSLLRQASSSASSTASTGSGSTKMAFFSSKGGSSTAGIPSLLRRARTTSSLGSMSGRENVSATGVVTSKTERGNAREEKEFVRKGNGGRRNAVNYQAERKTLREEKMSARAGVMKAGKGKKGHGFLGGLFRGDSWE